MNISDMVELIQETKNFLTEDYEFVVKKSSPTNKDLLKHIRNSYREGNLDELLEEIFSSYDLEEKDEDYKMLLLIAAAISENK
jgi:hypothetical protein